jgi:hypothetical protein
MPSTDVENDDTLIWLQKGTVGRHDNAEVLPGIDVVPIGQATQLELPLSNL